MKPKAKIKIAESGAGPALKHNPFGALAGASAPAAAELEVPAQVPASAEKKAPRGRLLLRRETKHRGGKTVVVIAGFASRPELDADAIAQLARDLKRELGCGGSVESIRNGEHEVHEIVVQGDQPARVADLLRARGFRVGGVTE